MFCLVTENLRSWISLNSGTTGYQWLTTIRILLDRGVTVTFAASTHAPSASWLALITFDMAD